MSILGKFFEVYNLKHAILVIVLCTLFWIYKKYDRNNLLRKGFPGLKIRFFNIVGHFSIFPSGPAYFQLYPRHTYFVQCLAAYWKLHLEKGLYAMWVFNQPFIVLYKAELIEAIYKSNTLLTKASTYQFLHPWLHTGLLTSTGAKWKGRRKLLTPSFHFDILKEFLQIMNEQVQVLVQILKNSDNEECPDLLKLITLCSLDIICETTLGVSINAQQNESPEYLKAVSGAAESIIQRSFNPFQWCDFIYRKTAKGMQFQKNINILHSFTKKVIREKKAILQNKDTMEQYEVGKKRKAFMDLLLDYHMTHDDFTEEDIQEEVDTFAFEGHDTSSMGLTWSLYLIGLYPDIQEAIHEELDSILPDGNCEITNEHLSEMKYLERVIKESLRLYPPVPFTGRKAENEATICEFKIPKGTEILQHIYFLHRDPHVFPNPEVFDPDRFLPENTIGRHPYAYVPFAAGPRNCIGQRFAMMELKTVAATILKHFTLKSLDPRDKILPNLELVLKPSHPIRLKIIQRIKA